MNNNPQTRIPTGGVDRTNLPHVTDPQKWWSLLNLRPVNGGLEQTPSLTNFAYFDALAGLEDSNVRVLETAVVDSQPKMLVGFEQDLLITDDTFTNASRVRPLYLWMTQAPLATDTTTPAEIDDGGSVVDEEVDVLGTVSDLEVAVAPAGSTEVHHQVLLYGTLPNRFKQLGDTFTLEILTATTARWKFNSGDWYDFTIALSVNIDPGLDIYLSFMETDGFNPGDTWVWEVTALAPLAESTTVEVARYNSDVYLSGYGRQVIRLRDGMLTSVGYKPVYGRHVAVFYNHLVVSRFAEGQMLEGVINDSYDAKVTPWRLAWSHLNNPDQFYPTDLNEADLYDFSATTGKDRLSLGITGLAQYNDVLVIYLTNSIYIMRYVGLPNVMQIDVLSMNVGSIFSAGLVATNDGHFFIGTDNIYQFDGTKPAPMGFEVCEQFFDEVGSATTNPRYDWTYGRYDAERSEVVWTYWIALSGGDYQCKQLIYQVDFKRFYFRHLPSVTTADCDVRAWINNPQVRGDAYYGGKQVVMSDVRTLYNFRTLVPDDVTDTQTQPYAETPDLFYGDLMSVKEHSSFLLDAYYTTGTGLQVEHSARPTVSTPVSWTVLEQVWTKTTPERTLSFPRISGVVFRFRITALNREVTSSVSIPGFPPVITVSVKPIEGLKLYGYADFLYNNRAEK